MEVDYITTVAVVSILTVIILDRAFSALKSRGVDLPQLARQIEEMHKWHSVTDDDGVKVWYVRQSLVDAIVKLTKVLDRMDRRLERIEDNTKPDSN